MHTRSKSRSCKLCCCRNVSPTQNRVMLIFFPPAQAHRAAGGWWAPPFQHCSWSPWSWGDLTHQHEQRGGSGTQVPSLASLPASLKPYGLYFFSISVQPATGDAKQGGGCQAGVWRDLPPSTGRRPPGMHSSCFTEICSRLPLQSDASFV